MAPTWLRGSASTGCNYQMRTAHRDDEKTLVEWSEDEEVVDTDVLVPLRLRPKLREEPRLSGGETTRGPERIIGAGIGESEDGRRN